MPPRQAAEARHALFIVDQLAELGGGERVLLQLVRGLPRHGYRCSLITLKPEINAEIRDAIACPLHIYPLQRSYDAQAWRTAGRLRALIRGERVGIVQTFFESSDLWGGLHAKLSGRVKLVSSRRDMGILRRRKHEALYRLINPLFDRVVAVSEAVRQTVLAREHLPPEKVVTIPNGLDLERACAAASRPALRSRLGLASEATVITTVGNLRRVKGTDVFLRAAARIAAQHENAVFVIAGGEAEPAYAAELRHLAGALGIADQVRFLGGVRDVFPLLQASDVFCLLSRSEGLPNSLLEAMACALPCVATGVGGTPEVVTDHVDGRIVASEDSDAAAAGVLALLRDPAAAQQMGARARATVMQRFTLQAMVARHAALYDELLGGAARAAAELA